MDKRTKRVTPKTAGSADKRSTVKSSSCALSEAVLQSILTVDVALLTLKDNRLAVVLNQRDHEPFKDALALPGAFVDPAIDIDTTGTAARLLRDKVGLQSPYLEQLRTYSGGVRDPRGWSLSVAYYALVPPELIDASGHPRMRLVDVDDPLASKLPFDHREILADAVSRLRSKTSYSSLPCYLAGEVFTRPGLQKIYEAILGEPLFKSNFNKKLDEMGILEPVPSPDREVHSGRPAQYYRLKAKFRRSPLLLTREI